ncbi:MAG: hypothetical protein DME25_16130, partial [Verrucomicrobia bacterium]
RARREEFDDLDRGTVKMITCVAFGRSDGLASVQCNGVAKPSAWKARDGRLWFPTIRGVVAVEPRIKTNENPPPVAIEEIFADGRKIQSQGGPSWTLDFAPKGKAPLAIPPGRGELEIHYTALSFQAPGKNRFKYLLEGVDSDWIDAGARRGAYYNHLGPGNYRFRVMACNNDGVWNESGASVVLVFQPWRSCSRVAIAPEWLGSALWNSSEFRSRVTCTMMLGPG